MELHLMGKSPFILLHLYIQHIITTHHHFRDMLEEFSFAWLYDVNTGQIFSLIFVPVTVALWLSTIQMFWHYGFPKAP